MSCTQLLKVGFGLAEDFRKLRAAHPSLGAVCSAHPVRELADFYKALKGKFKASQPPGLSHLAKDILGKPLDKRMRLTNWARRPLTQPQLEYAALDAHCLLLISDGITKQLVAHHAEPKSETCRGGRQQRVRNGCEVQVAGRQAPEE